VRGEDHNEDAMMRKPEFNVVTFVILVLATLGALVASLRGKIPPAPENRLAPYSSPFLQMAKNQPVGWYPFSDEPFRLARRNERPIMLFIGSATSPTVRRLDDILFKDEDLANYLERNFISIRLDSTELPEWASIYLPISRFRIDFSPEAQIWFLDPAGEPYEKYLRTSTTDKLNYDRVVGAIHDAARAYDNFRRTNSSPLFQQQNEDIARLSTNESTALDFRGFTQSLRDDPNVTVVAGRRYLAPSVLRFLARIGQTESAMRLADTYVYSPMHDGIQGGFFHSALGGDRRRITFDKLAVENAEMAAAFAELAATTGSQVHRKTATAAFDFVVRDLAIEGGISPYLLGDDKRNEKSESRSFAWERLSSVLGESDARWAQENLGLRLSDGPFLSAYPVSPRTFEDPKWTSVASRLRESLAGRLKAAPDRQLDIEGTVAARLIEAMRLLGDRDRLEVALALSDRLSSFKTGKGWLRSLAAGQNEPAGIVSRLAYADAKLQTYMATGRIIDFRDGLDCLNEILEKDRDAQTGTFPLLPNSKDLRYQLPLSRSVGMVDLFRESEMATLVRLCSDYGRLTGDAKLTLVGVEAVDRGSSIAGANHATLAGFWTAAAKMQDNAFVFVTGIDAVERAGQLSSRWPGRLVAPAVADIRRDLQSKGAGIYLVRGSEVTGPLTEAQARAGLPPLLSFGF